MINVKNYQNFFSFLEILQRTGGGQSSGNKERFSFKKERTG